MLSVAGVVKEGYEMGIKGLKAAEVYAREGIIVGSIILEGTQCCQ